MAGVAKAQVVALEFCDFLGGLRRTERHVALVALVGPTLRLGHIEVHRVLGEALVSDLGGRLELHDGMAWYAVLRDQLGSLDLVVVAVLTAVAVGVTDVAVPSADTGVGSMVLQPVGRVRHDRLVAALARGRVVARTTRAFLFQVEFAVLPHPLGHSMVFGNDEFAELASAERFSTHVAFHAELRLVTHRAVRRVLVGAYLVVALLELLCVIAGLEIEVLGVACVTVLSGDKTACGVGQAVAAIAPHHVRPTYLLLAVAELRMADRALVVAAKVLGVLEDDGSRQEVIYVRVTVDALADAGRAVRIHLHGRLAGLVRQQRVVDGRHRADLYLQLDVALVAVLLRLVAHHAGVHALLGAFGMRLVLPRLNMIPRPEVEGFGVTIGAFPRCDLALRAVLQTVAVETCLHRRRVRLAALVRELVVAGVATHQQVHAVAEDESRLVRLCDAQVTWSAVASPDLSGQLYRIRGLRAPGHGRLVRDDAQSPQHDRSGRQDDVHRHPATSLDAYFPTRHEEAYRRRLGRPTRRASGAIGVPDSPATVFCRHSACVKLHARRSDYFRMSVATALRSARRSCGLPEADSISRATSMPPSFQASTA